MIILSQDKRTIINFYNIAHIFIIEDDKTIGYGNMIGCSEELGKYETEKRAKEVLREIVNTYMCECKTYIMPED